MIAVDTSALVAVLWGEPEESRIRSALTAAGRALVSAASMLELQLVVADRRNMSGWPQAEALCKAYAISIHPFDERQLALAREAAMRFGKGRHPARLNFGDCFAYALARSEGVPLLCTGDDFRQTDIAIA